MTWVILSFALKNKRFALEKNCIFLHVFLPFSTAFPFYAQERIVPIGLCSIVLFLKSDGSDSLLSLFTKEWPWVKRSPRSFELLFHSLHSSQKTSDSLINPKSELPTLLYWISLRWTFYCFTTFFHLTNPSGPKKRRFKVF